MINTSDNKLIPENSHQRKQQDFEDLTSVNKEMTCYESTINCCGDTIGCCRAWCPCICFMFPYPYKLIQQAEKGLIQKFGKFQRVLQPGLHEINPCSDRVIVVGIKTYVLDLERQVILTKDNITLDIDTIVYYRIVDAPKATYRVKNLEQSIKEITYATLRTVCGEHTLQEALEKRLMLADEIEGQVFDVVSDWGVYMEQIFIKDMIMSEQLQSALSMAPKAVRIAQSKIISAKSDVDAAKLLREAADMLDSKAAMQIRYFETIQKIAQGNNQKILFLPLQADEEAKAIKK